MTVPVALFGVWLAAGIGAAAITFRALTRPNTLVDETCSRDDDDLNEQVAATIIASRLDVADQPLLDEDDEDDGEFTELDLEWLAQHSIAGAA